MTDETEVSFGQLYSWREVDSYPPEFRSEANFGVSVDLEGQSADRVRAVLDRIEKRHEAFRTTYRTRDGVPVQVVHPVIERPLEWIDRPVTDSQDRERSAEALARQPIEPTGRPCWRGQLVTTGGRPRFLSLSFSHLTFDIWSIEELARQVGALTRDPNHPDPVSVSQRQLAAEQRSAAAEARRRGAERYWQRILDAEDVFRPPTPNEREKRARIQATVHSHRVGWLAAQAAARLKVTAPTVFLALFAAGLAKHTGHRRLAMSVMSSNRFTPQLRTAIGTINQLAPITATVEPAADVARHVKAMHWTATKAYHSSCYDIDRVGELAGGASFTALFPSWFNFIQLDDIAPLEYGDKPADLEWSIEPRPFGQPFDVRITAVRGLTVLALRTDPTFLGADAVVDILRGVALGAQRLASGPAGSIDELWRAAATELSADTFPTRRAVERAPSVRHPQVSPIKAIA